MESAEGRPKDASNSRLQGEKKKTKTQKKEEKKKKKEKK